MVVTDRIPRGFYCYSYDENNNLVRCPFWNYVTEHNAYCEFLDADDDTLHRRGHLGMLWDQIKECGINEPD